MKILFKISLIFPFFACGIVPKIENLPWINAKDRDAAYLAKPFLPKCPVILEAGVCDATDTLQFKKIWPKATIYGFEPNPDFYKKATMKTSGLKNIKIYNKALFQYSGNIQFFVSNKYAAASSVLEDNLTQIVLPPNHPGPSVDQLSYEDEPINVECITIDDWAKSTNISHVDYLWLDTEGAELNILKTATSILPKVKVISVEVNFQEFRREMTLFPDLYEFLYSQGFRIKYIWGNPKLQGVAIFVNQQIL